MKFDPVKYKRFERTPVGFFEAHMLASGWGETKFVNESLFNLLSDELCEFIRLVEHLFKECPDWTKLQKYVRKYGTEIHDDYDVFSAINFIGDRMDYTAHIRGTTLIIYPYRHFRH